MDDYINFLEKKDLTIKECGINVIDSDINQILFPFQRDIVRFALRRGKFAIFADTGLGKTFMQCEWAKIIHNKTKGKVLILAPLAVSMQTVKEALKIGITITPCRENEDVKEGINICNYEIMHKIDCSQFVGVVLDESSILKSYTAKTKQQIINAFYTTQYKLACSATPAPNDFIELGNHSEFLNALTRVEMLSKFFINDASDTGTWRLKGHAEDKFWQWMSEWSVVVKKPHDLGYPDDKFNLPKLIKHEHEVECDIHATGQLFSMDALTLSERRIVRKDTLNQRVQKALDIISKKPDEQWLVWCDYNVESEMLSKSIPGAVEVKGSDSNEHKEKSLLGFADGNIKILVSKPSIAGYGMNFQSCHNMLFIGLNDSYEQYYQAIRRCWRFGQTRNVNVHIIMSELDSSVLNNLIKKEKQADKMSEGMVKHITTLFKEKMNNLSVYRDEYKMGYQSGDNWEMHLGDSCEIIKKIPDESIGYQIFSPPFASLFTYSASNRDIGNCKDYDEFTEHFLYLVPELLRVSMPGRLVSVHCMNLPATISHDGFIGMKDFRGDIIRIFVNAGFIYHSEVAIWKDPLVQATRTKNLTLAHKQISKDSSRCAMGYPDYVCTFRKPGLNPIPIEHGRGFERYIGEMDEPTEHKTNDARTNKYSHMVWQRYASPVWFDIRQTRTLNERSGREEKDEKHICPLQLDTIERCLELWSMPGDTVLSPFAGIGSEGYVSIQNGRKFIGIELKESYFNQACKNLSEALIRDDYNQMRLFA